MNVSDSDPKYRTFGMCAVKHALISPCVCEDPVYYDLASHVYEYHLGNLVKINL